MSNSLPLPSFLKSPLRRPQPSRLNPFPPLTREPLSHSSGRRIPAPKIVEIIRDIIIDTLQRIRDISSEERASRRSCSWLGPEFIGFAAHVVSVDPLNYISAHPLERRRAGELETHRTELVTTLQADRYIGRCVVELCNEVVAIRLAL